MPTAAFTTLGCKVNQYETQKILESFEEAGFAIVPFNAPADVYVINTCSVTSIAESKSRYTIRKARRTNPTAKVVVTGCAAQMAKNKNEEMELAHVLVPNPEKLTALKHLYTKHPEIENEVLKAPATKNNTPLTGRTRATLKIQDGCSVYCSYCSIPYTRPVMNSVPKTDVLREAERQVALGHKEIVLTGVLIGSYGPETGSEGPNFEDLLELLSAIPGLERIRISSIEMNQVTERLIELIKFNPKKIMPHLHIPLQAGDTQVLKDMNRPYQQDDYLRLCEKLYQEIPDLSLTTDILVGFPTEDEMKFLSSAKVCEHAKYLKAHLFRFSPRYGTPADKWGDPISPEEKQRRSRVLLDITTHTGQKHAKKFIGRTLRVLVEGKKQSSGLLRGLTDNYLEVEFAGPLSLIGQMAEIQIHEFKDGLLIGELADLSTQTGATSKLTSLRMV